MSIRHIYGPAIGHESKDWEKSKAWFEANGVAPENVLLRQTLELDTETKHLTFTEIARNPETGKVIIGLDDCVVTTRRTIGPIAMPQEFGLFAEEVSK